jgi:hypothetical protein
MRALYLLAQHGPVRAILNGRYGLANACEDACADISALAWDWADDNYAERERKHRYD